MQRSLSGVRLLTLPATPGGLRPFARVTCESSTTPMGAYPRCSSLWVCTSNGAQCPRVMPFQAPQWGGIAKAYAMQEAGGRRWKLRNRGSRTPEGEVGRSTDAPVALLGVLRGWADCERGPALGGRSRTGGAHPKRVFGFFLHEQKETRPSGRNRKPPAGAGTGKSHRACRHPRQRAKEKRRPQAALLCHTRLPSHWARGI